MNIGDMSIEIVSGGTLRLDAGNMFGPVPRLLWEKKVHPDSLHRVAMDTNVVLIRRGNERILIDTGYGSKAGAKQREFQGLEEGEPLTRNLASRGIKPTDITAVIITHLHFDHVGGCTRRTEEGQLEIVFPNARHYVQRAEWGDANARLPELAGSYFEEDFQPLAEAGLVEFIDGDQEILADISVKVVGGHTRGMQIVQIGSQPTGAPAVVALADLAPTIHHLKAFWSMSYDQYPLDVRRTKPVILGSMADDGSTVLFSHDTGVRAAKLHRDTKQEFTATPVDID